MGPITALTCTECGVPVMDQSHCPQCGAEIPEQPSPIGSNADHDPTMTSTPMEPLPPSPPATQTTSPEQASQQWPSAQGGSPQPEPGSQESEEMIALEEPEIRGWDMEWKPLSADSLHSQGKTDDSTSSPTLSQSSVETDHEISSSQTDTLTEQLQDPDLPPTGAPPDHELPPPAPSHPEPGSDSFRIRHPLFWGQGRSLFGIFIVNTFLTLVTLGIYSFWGRVRVREYLNSQTSFAGARFAYHGTGKELFLGWLKAVLIFGVPYIFFSYMPVFWNEIPQLIPNVIAGLLVLCFIPVAVVGAHRYRLSRTSLRNIRFSFRGSISDFMQLWFKGSLLSVLTLGFYYPYFENARRAYLTTHSQIGNHPFEYEGQGKDLLKIYVKALGLFFLTIILVGVSILLGLTFIGKSFTELHEIIMASGLLVGVSAIIPGVVAWFYLQAAKQRYFWGRTHIGEAQFVSTVTAWKLFELRVGHLVLLITTLGLAWPWVQTRNLQFFYYYLGLHGSLDFSRIEQDALDASPTGEELAGFFDTGFDLG